MGKDSGFQKDPVAESVPFESSEFTSDNTQDAIIEAKQNAEGFPRAGISLVYNGTLGGGDFISYSNLTPDVDIIFPVNTKINEITFANDRSNVDGSVEIFKNGTAPANLLTTIDISTTGGGRSKFFDLNSLNINLIAGEFLKLRFIDQGINPRDAIFVLFFSRIP